VYLQLLALLLQKIDSPCNQNSGNGLNHVRGVKFLSQNCSEIIREPMVLNQWFGGTARTEFVRISNDSLKSSFRKRKKKATNFNHYSQK
jgi:hypothetical protein